MTFGEIFENPSSAIKLRSPSSSIKSQIVSLQGWTSAHRSPAGLHTWT